VTPAQVDWAIQQELKKPLRFRPLSRVNRPRLSLSNLKVEVHRGVKKLAATTSAIADLWNTLKDGHTASYALVRTTIEEFADLSSLDLDLLPLIVSMQENSASPDFLFEHSASVSILSMSIAAQLGLNREQVSEVGLGALLQDIGMMRVPKEIRFAARPLTSEEWVEIRNHPIYTLNILDNIRALPDTVKFIAYQSHERGDQSGYPRQRSGMFVHQFAKITAVADAYVAMSRARPHREAFTPYAACKAILTDASANKFDRTIVRALLDTISLFPIGSTVELNNGTWAKVIRANPGFHTSPVVYELNSDGTSTGRMIDLSKEPRLCIVSAG
jgi:HD-GYP domain-containing protein (c-di-GMP phosphodiesterase class II)